MDSFFVHFLNVYCLTNIINDPAAVRLMKVVSLVNLVLKLMVGMCPIILALVFLSLFILKSSFPHSAVVRACIIVYL